MTSKNKRFFVVCGLPRSGTTHFADKLTEYFSNINMPLTIYDEINPCDFIYNTDKRFNRHLRKSKLSRNATIGENKDRFLRKAENFNHNLSVKKIFNNVFYIDNKIPVFKYPRILESNNFRRLMRNLMNNYDIYIFFLTRPSDQVFESFRRRNMYFSRYWPFNIIIQYYISTYKKIEMSLSPFIVSNETNIKDINLSEFLLFDEHLRLIDDKFKFFIIWRYFFKMTVILRNKVLRKSYW